jgi:hypothetical protein
MIIIHAYYLKKKKPCICIAMKAIYYDSATISVGSKYTASKIADLMIQNDLNIGLIDFLLFSTTHIFFLKKKKAETERDC